MPAIRGWHLSRTINPDLTLRQALSKCRPRIYHSDQDIHYASHSFVVTLQCHLVQISMGEEGKPEDNGYAEHLIRTIKEEGRY